MLYVFLNEKKNQKMLTYPCASKLRSPSVLHFPVLRNYAIRTLRKSIDHDSCTNTQNSIDKIAKNTDGNMP